MRRNPLSSFLSRFFGSDSATLANRRTRRSKSREQRSTGATFEVLEPRNMLSAMLPNVYYTPATPCTQGQLTIIGTAKGEEFKLVGSVVESDTGTKQIISVTAGKRPTQQIEVSPDDYIYISGGNGADKYTIKGVVNPVEMQTGNGVNTGCFDTTGYLYLGSSATRFTVVDTSDPTNVTDTRRHIFSLNKGSGTVTGGDWPTSIITTGKVICVKISLGDGDDEINVNAGKVIVEKIGDGNNSLMVSAGSLTANSVGNGNTYISAWGTGSLNYIGNEGNTTASIGDTAKVDITCTVGDLTVWLYDYGQMKNRSVSILGGEGYSTVYLAEGQNLRPRVVTNLDVDSVVFRPQVIYNYYVVSYDADGNPIYTQIDPPYYYGGGNG